MPNPKTLPRKSTSPWFLPWEATQPEIWPATCRNARKPKIRPWKYPNPICLENRLALHFVLSLKSSILTWKSTILTLKLTFGQSWTLEVTVLTLKSTVFTWKSKAKRRVQGPNDRRSARCQSQTVTFKVHDWPTSSISRSKWVWRFQAQKIKTRRFSRHIGLRYFQGRIFGSRALGRVAG